MFHLNVTSVLWGNKIYETIRTADFLVESRCGQTFQRLAIGIAWSVLLKGTTWRPQ